MEQINEEIKKEFNDKIKNIEEVDSNRKKMINTLWYTVGIILFLCVLAGTIVSVKNYFDAKKQQEDNNNIPSVTFK